MSKPRSRQAGNAASEALMTLTIAATALLLVLPAAREASDAGARAACAANLKQLGSALRMYAEEHGSYPPVAWHYGAPMDCAVSPPSVVNGTNTARLAYTMDFREMHPDYLSDAAVLVCPSDDDLSISDLVNPVSNEVDVWYPCEAPCRGWSLADNSYAYLGALFGRDYRMSDDSADRFDWSARKPTELIELHPFPRAPEMNFWADVFSVWDDAHPFEKMTDLTGDGPDIDPPIHLGFFAWHQVLGDAFYQGDPANVHEVVKTTLQYEPFDRFFSRRALGGVPWIATDAAQTVDWPSVWMESGPFANTYIGVCGVPTNGGEFLWTAISDDRWARVPAEVMVEMPRMSERQSAHHRGANVLYADGHVEFVPPDIAETRSVLMSDAMQWGLRLTHHFQEELAHRPTGNLALDAQCR